eukprot:PITA_28022
MESLDMKEYCSQVQFLVNVIASIMVPPSRPSPKTILYLSNLDDQMLLRVAFDALLVYTNVSQKVQNPVKVIRDALSEALTYYYPLAGRVTRTQDGRKFQVECTGDGALFVEAATDNTLSELGILEDLKPSFAPLLHHFAEVEDVPALIFQVTRFKCGGLVVGASFSHSLCDGRGAAQFLNGVAEIARGEAKLSIEPVWQREVLKPHQPPIVRFPHDEFIESGFLVNPNSAIKLGTVKADDLVISSFFLSSDALQRIKQPIAEELEEHCTTFEVLSALAWRARTIALGISLHHAVRLIFTVDVRTVLKPPLAEGYFGNALYLGCARSATAQEVVNGSLSRAVKMIKKAKTSVNDECVRSSISFLEMKRPFQKITDVQICPEDTYLSDWRWLGFHQVDFGLGQPSIVWPGKILFCPILMLPPPESESGVMMVFCVPPPALKALKTEMHRFM